MKLQIASNQEYAINFRKDFSLRKTRDWPASFAQREAQSRFPRKFLRKLDRFLYDSIVGPIGTISLAKVVESGKLKGSAIERGQTIGKRKKLPLWRSANVRITRDILILYRVSQTPSTFPHLWRIHDGVAEKNDICFKVVEQSIGGSRTSFLTLNAYKWQTTVA